MSIEQIWTFQEGEIEKTFEKMGYTRNFGVVKKADLKRVLEENSEYWRVPTISEFLALKKKNKRNFFDQKSYWAMDPMDGDLSFKLREVRLGFFGEPTWFLPEENPNREKYLVLFKKGTVIDGAEEETEKFIEKFNI